MIGNSMLGRVIAVALAVGAVAPVAEAQDWQGRGFQQQDDEVRRVGRRGRDDGDEESASDEAHDRNAEREAQREAERQQREQERANEQQARQAEQQQREEARMYEQQQRQAEQQQREESRMYEQQQRQAEQQQREAEQQQRQAEQQQREAERQAEQQQREAMRGMEQQQRQAEQQQREMQRAAEQQQRQAEMEQRAYQREQRQAEQLRQPPIEAEQAREQQRRGRDGRGGREEGWAEQERAREQAAGEQYRAEQQRQAGSASPATEELRRVERERTQVERGGDRERYQDYREGREGRGGRERDVAGEPQPQWRDRDQRRDAQQWDDPRRRWSADPRQVAIPRDGARLSDRERRTFYDQQRQSADRYGRDWSRRIDSQQRRIESLQHDRRGQQYRYQQRYWQRHRDYRSRWTSFRWNYDRDPFFWTAPSHRYYRGGRWYSVNRYALDVLQQAIRIGYEEGYYAGEADRYDGWRGGWRDNYAYEDATLGFQGWYVGENEYRYYFREGFRRGYEDAFYRRWRYGRRYESGYSILPNELDLILRFELRR